MRGDALLVPEARPRALLRAPARMLPMLPPRAPICKLSSQRGESFSPRAQCLSAAGLGAYKGRMPRGGGAARGGE